MVVSVGRRGFPVAGPKQLRIVKMCGFSAQLTAGPGTFGVPAELVEGIR